ncbi:MAG TPA: VWA domain-containing protein [Candidatus Polarisedimenticolaceae bacterium]
MRFAAPEMLAWLLAVPVVVSLWVASSWRARRRLARFAADPEAAARFAGEASTHRRAAKALLLLLAIVSGVVALARPQWGTGVDAVTRKGVDVAFVVDTSLSMAAGDVPPDRLGLARHAAGTLIDKLVGDRLALVSFAGRASLVAPLTVDHEAVRLFLDALDPEAVSVPGTALAEGIRAAVRAFATSESGEARGRAILVFSDGEDHEGGLEEAIDVARKAGAKVWAIGVGTEQGAPIPYGGPGEWKKDRDGRVVTTRLDAPSLARLADATGGKYYTATAGEVELDAIARDLGAMEGEETGTVLRTRYTERFAIPLAVAVAALFAEAFVAERRRRSAA